jgi:hypothetical protein
MATNDNKPSFFARYIDSPPPIEKTREPSEAQKLLNFLQHWGKPTVCTREILIYGPRCLRRDRERAINSADILVRHGWLVPAKKHRRDMNKWEIVRKPIVPPTIATVAAE